MDTPSRSRVSPHQEIESLDITRPCPMHTGPALAGNPVSRGAALFLGLFALLSVAAEIHGPGVDADFCWIDLRPLRVDLARGVLGLAAAGMILYALCPRAPSTILAMCSLSTIVLMSIAVANTIQFYRMQHSRLIHAGGLAFNLHLIVCLAVAVSGMVSRPKPTAGLLRDLMVMLGSFAVCLIAFPLALMFCYGKVDFRTNADAVVVFQEQFRGLSAADAARHASTATELLKDGLADRVIAVSGFAPNMCSRNRLVDLSLHPVAAPGESNRLADGEPRSLSKEQVAAHLQVPPEYVIMQTDIQGTADPVQRLTATCRQHGFRRLLVVAPFYELPRLKLALRRSALHVATVPNGVFEQTRLPPAHEIVAFWQTILKPVRHPGSSPFPDSDR